MRVEKHKSWIMKDDDVASDNLSPGVRIFIKSLLNEANAGIADDVFKTVFDRTRTNNKRNDRHRGKLIDSKKQQGETKRPGLENPR
jgi:hypothetical protein